MITQLNNIAQIWWQWMGSMFWQVSLLIIVVTALDMALRKWAWPQVRYALWALVFIKLIIPPTWQMPTSIVSWIQPKVEEQISVQIRTSGDRAISSQTPFSQYKQTSSVAIEKVTWKTLVLLCWISGVVFFSFMLLRKIRLFRKWRQIQDSKCAPKWFNELMVKTAQRLKLKRVPSVIFSKDAKTPAVYGVFRSVLLLPEGYFDQLSQEQAEHVLFHELCHLKRGDLLIHWCCMTLQIVYWFNPLLIWTRRRMRHVCEICCDLSVANILREKTSKYRDTLLRSARELFTETLEPGLGFLGIFEESFRLVPRLKWLEKKSWENRKRRIAVTICTSLIMITCVMPMAGLSQPDAQNNTLIAQSDDNPAESSENQTLDADNVSRQVFYELLIMEVDVNKEFDINAEGFRAIHGNQIDDGDPPTMNNGFLFGIFEGDIIINGKSFVDLAELIKEMGTEPDVKILSAPKILASSGSTASLSSVQRDPELSFEVTPQIMEDNSIQQEITIAIKGVDKESGRIWKREGSTKIMVKEGSILLIVIPGTDAATTIERPEGLLIFLKPRLLPLEKSQANLKAIELEQAGRFSEPDSDDSQSDRYFDINFSDTDILVFIKYISEITGKNFLVGNNVRGKVSVIGAKKVTVDEAYKIFESVLEVHGYTTVPSGNVIKIVEKKPEAKASTLEPKEKEISASTDPEGADEILAYSKKQLSLLESEYSSSHPDVIRLKEIVAGLETAE